MFRLQTYDKVSSTNELIKKALAAGESEGLAVQALSQTEGYGRQGRIWESPEGGLYLSLLLRPQAPIERLATLSLVIGVAVRRAIVSLLDARYVNAVLLKWPNDVVLATNSLCSCSSNASSGLGGKQVLFAKLCGISLETYAGGVCVGIGVNVVPSTDEMEVRGKNIPAYLAHFANSDIECVRDAVLREVEVAYCEWIEKGFEPFREEFCRFDALRNCQVSMANHLGEITARGIAQGVNEQACLLVFDGEEVLAVSSGEVHVCG